MFTNIKQSYLVPTAVWPRQWMQATTRFVGIDIGVDRVQVASFGSLDSRSTGVENPNASLSWLSRTEFELPIDPSRPPTPSLVDSICETLSECLPRCVDGERQVAALALPLPWIHYETVPSSELADSQAMCDSMFEASVFQSPAHLSHWPVCDGKQQQVVAAAAEFAACRVAEATASVGYRVQSILPHGVALIHAARELTSVAPHSVVLLERFGGLVCVNNANRCGLCRALPACGQTDRSHEYIDQLEPWLEEIASEVTATSRYVARLAGRSNSHDPVLIAGSVAQIPGVDELLATLLGRPVATWRYASRIRPVGANDPDNDFTRLDPSRAVAISLAQCAASRFSIGGR